MILSSADNIKVGSNDVNCVRLNEFFIYEATAFANLLSFLENGSSAHKLTGTLNSAKLIGSLTIPSSHNSSSFGGTAKPVNRLEDNALDFQTQLTSVIIPNSVTTIGQSVFSSCSALENITIPSSVTSIGNFAFTGTNLKGVVIPDSVTVIASSLFMGSNLDTVTLGDSVTSIQSNAFSNCSKLASITIPDSVTTIGDGAFKTCTSLTSLTIPDGVTSIGVNTFNRCSSLSSINIPDGVTNIGGHAFRNCSSLTTITIPDSVTSIGASAFRDCSSLSRINCLATTPPTMGNGAFSSVAFDTNGFQSIHVPASASSAYGSVFAGLTVVADL